MPDDIDPLQPDDAVERHIDEFVAKAIEIRRERPCLRMVGLVAEADATEAPALRETLPEARSEVECRRGRDARVRAQLARRHDPGPAGLVGG
jgi:hypothetical protein